MKKLQYLLLTIPATLLISTSANAQEVSTKATDLVASVPSAQSNQQNASEQYPFVIAQNADEAEADENVTEMNYWYISGSAGLHFPSDITGTDQFGGKGSLGTDGGFQGSVAVGYQWSQARAELELAYSAYGVNSINPGNIPVSGDGSVTSIFLNGYWDIPTGSKLRPYVGAGIGVGFPSASEIKFAGVPVVDSGSSSALALQAKAGIQYEVTKKGNLFLEAKYQHLGAHSIGSGIDKVDYDGSGTFGLGIGYRQGF